MERNKVDESRTDNVCKTSSAQVSNNTRLTPGKFPDLVENEKIVTNIQNYGEDNVHVNDFYLYSTNIDTNAIWNTNKDLKRSYSLPSQSLYTIKSENKDGHETLNSIWNSKYNSNESLSPTEDLNGSYKISEISIDINDFENLDVDYTKSTNNDTSNLINVREPKENYTSEESKKIVSIINSHEGWGVKPVNQKTPWDIPDADNNNNENYQNTFSNWFNEAPNGVCVWDSYETAKKQSVSDWSNAVKGKVNSNYATTQPNTVWSTVANDSIWPSSTAFNNCGVVGSTKMNYGTTATNYSSIDSNLAAYPIINRVPTTRMTNDKMKNTGWTNDVNKPMMDFKALSSSCSVDRYTVPRPKNMDNELSNHKMLKDAQKQLIEQYQKDVRKIQEIDNNLSALSKLPEVQARPILTELLRQRQTIQQRNHNYHSQIDAISLRVSQIEDILGSYNRTASYGTSTPIDTKYIQPQPTTTTDMLAAKLDSMKLQQQCMDFRPDVPEFIPGKKWYGLTQNGKENRNPTNDNTKMAGSSDVAAVDIQDGSNYSTTWLLIQNLPSHISIEMIQSFFIQNNNPCVTPIHNNPFSRWVLVKFPNQFSSQKAFHMVSGKVGQVSLITDQDANLKLQELKGVMARFVAH